MTRHFSKFSCNQLFTEYSSIVLVGVSKLKYILFALCESSDLYIDSVRRCHRANFKDQEQQWV